MKDRSLTREAGDLVPRQEPGLLVRTVREARRRAVEAGLPPAAVGWRHVRRETPLERATRLGGAAHVETIHPAAEARNALPHNVSDREDLNADPGWWGYAFRDVPSRASGPTRLFRFSDIRAVCYGAGAGEKFHPALLGHDGRSIELPQMVFRPGHGEVLRRGLAPGRRARATWILERVYDNHSHWLTAHLPKIVLLRNLGALDDVLLPERRTPVMDATLRMLGLDPAAFPSFDPDRPLDVETLTLVETDRFRPELLQAVRAAVDLPDAAEPTRRIFVSRARSRGRRLVAEETLWARLEKRGFERIFMEALSFPDQARLMAETAVLVAPHGAGLTNMMFCRPGAQVAEIADVAYPNPNFYAVAAAMDLGYWLIPAEGVGPGHPLERDLAIDVEATLAAVDRMTAEAAPA